MKEFSFRVMWYAKPGHYDLAADVATHYPHARLEHSGVCPLQIVGFAKPMQLTQGLHERARLRDWVIQHYGDVIRELTCYIEGETDDSFFAKVADSLEAVATASMEAVREIKHTRRWGVLVPAGAIGTIRRTLARKIYDRHPCLNYCGIMVPNDIGR